MFISYYCTLGKNNYNIKFKKKYSDDLLNIPPRGNILRISLDILNAVQNL